PGTAALLAVTPSRQRYRLKVDAPARGVLPEVAQDVRQPEGDAEVDGVGLGFGRAGPENLQADEPDRRRDSVAVLVELAECGVAVDGEIHLHARDDVVEVFPGDPQPTDVLP